MRTQKRAMGLALAAVTSIILWQFTAGRYLLYPFTIMATWFHEMGHGLCALLLGGSFVKLQLFADGSGVAVHSGTLFFGQIGSALVAAAGPLGPALAGSLLILFSLRPTWCRLGLTGLAVAMLLSALIWIRTLFGFGMIVSLALLLLWIRLKGNAVWHSLSLHFIGIQACLSLFLQINYLFTEKVLISGELLYSDTGQIAAALFFPYWFWAILLTGITLLLPVWSTAYALKGSSTSK